MAKLQPKKKPQEPTQTTVTSYDLNESASPLLSDGTGVSNVAPMDNTEEDQDNPKEEEKVEVVTKPAYPIKIVIWEFRTINTLNMSQNSSKGWKMFDAADVNGLALFIRQAVVPQAGNNYRILDANFVS